MFQPLQVFYLDITYATMAIHICFKCFSYFKRMLQVFYLEVGMLHWLYTYVASVCFSCFKRMLQVFYLDVAYLAVVIHICCKRMFVNVSFVLNICCNKCFML
jgi:hypothetical protein